MPSRHAKLEAGILVCGIVWLVSMAIRLLAGLASVNVLWVVCIVVATVSVFASGILFERLRNDRGNNKRGKL